MAETWTHDRKATLGGGWYEPTDATGRPERHHWHSFSSDPHVCGEDRGLTARSRAASLCPRVWGKLDYRAVRVSRRVERFS